MEDNLIEATNLSYAYRSATGPAVKALDDISITVRRGELVAITGRNGSGKSTLARHFNALLIPSEGHVLIKGLLTTEKKNIPGIRRTVGMVFQNPDNQLISSIVEEDIAFGPENLGVPQDEIRSKVDHALRVMELESLRYEAPNRLSEGQKQLVAIAGVLAMQPECIILDEPTAHLDPRGRRDVIKSVIRLNKEEGITIVWLTHFMNEAAKCDRMLIMDSGKVVMEGPPRHIFRRGNEIAAYGLDLPVTTCLAAGLHKQGFDVKPDITDPEELVDCLCQLKL
ncbi:MAG: energy-coupling factor transporter ATPase [Firmicutes bacterium ML8_F2]|nr:MAG: energy-coupling factor transporter ATPase [Firmicutes bacterium ML8_F2]